MKFLDFTCRLLAAMGLGALIGLERQLTGRAAGIRTCVLVCMGSASFTAFPLTAADGDVTRAAMQIISGVGFLGSGVIFKDGSNVRGLNTAATVWCTAGVGIFAGAGLYSLAAAAAGCLLTVNIVLRLLTSSGRLWGRFDVSGHLCDLSLSCDREQEPAVRAEIIRLLMEERFYLIRLRSRNESDGRVRFDVRFACDSGDQVSANERLLRKLARLPTVGETGWEALE